jgi:hypothetical protein
MPIVFSGWSTWGPFAIPHFSVVIRGNKKKPTPETEVIGVKDATLSHKVLSGTSLTQTTFDTTTRPDQARILLTNATGGARVITACWIRGKLINKVGGDSGYCNDKHVDYEAIARDGEQKFELGNDYICTLTQVNKLADYHWKLNKTKKHIYTVSLPGFQSYFEPGEWYALKIGSAGTAEYIDSTVECYSVRCSMNATGSMGTQVSFREVEENWKFDSNAVARYIAAGGHSRTPQKDLISVAAGDFGGYADYYCPGTSDDASVINSALADSSGREVRLSRGNYYIHATIFPPSNTLFGGNGPGTILNTSGLSATTNPCIAIFDTTSGRTSNVTVSDIGINEPVGFAAEDLIYIWGADHITIENMYLRSSNAMAITGRDCNFLTIIGNDITGASTMASTGSPLLGMIYLSAINQSIVSNNILHDAYISWQPGGADGLFMGGGSTETAHNIISNNIVSNLIDYTTDTTGVLSGIRIDADYCLVSSNKITGVKCSASTAIGLYVSANAGYTGISNNYCFNNGTDTGLANTNQCNFRDSGTNTQVG